MQLFNVHLVKLCLKTLFNNYLLWIKKEMLKITNVLAVFPFVYKLNIIKHQYRFWDHYLTQFFFCRWDNKQNWICFTIDKMSSSSQVKPDQDRMVQGNLMHLGWLSITKLAGMVDIPETADTMDFIIVCLVREVTMQSAKC